MDLTRLLGYPGRDHVVPLVGFRDHETPKVTVLSSGKLSTAIRKGLRGSPGHLHARSGGPMTTAAPSDPETTDPVPIEQHTLVRSLVLHLYPGLVILLV